jgi:type IV secretory pathway VirJ component
LLCHFRPIFIVNTVPDSESDNDGKNGMNRADESLVSQRADMEINNNNSLYLPVMGEDKGDNSDKFVQREKRVSQTVTTKASGFSRQKLVESSLKELIIIQAMETKTHNETVQTESAHDDSDESSRSLNGLVTQASDNIPETKANESSANKIDKITTISADSVELVKKCDEVNQLGVSTSKAPPIRERKSSMTQSKGESDVCSIIIFRLLHCHSTMIGRMFGE